MARFKMNNMVDEASGKVGKMVFRQVGTETLYTKAPKRKEAWTDKQFNQRERFRRAASYAKEVIKDPAKKAEYAEKVKGIAFKNAFTAAMADYLKAPVVDNADTTLYHGNAGESILLSVYDNFKVASVQVTILHANGTQVEFGAAVPVPDSTQWKYVTTAANAAVAGSKLSVVVTDKPGNITTFEKTL